MSGHYSFEVKTADQIYAGTDSNIFVVLYGELGQSDEVRLNGYIKGNAFERNQKDSFDIPFRDMGGDIGKVYRMDMRSDCKYAGSDWRVSYVKIQRKGIGEDDDFSNVASKFNYNIEITNTKTHSKDVDMNFKNKCKYECVIEPYQTIPFSLASHSTYDEKHSVESSSGFKYSNITTKQNTTKFYGEITGKASYSETAKVADSLENVQAAEAFLKFGFEKGFSETTVNEMTRTENKKITDERQIKVVNDTDDTKDYEIVYNMKRMKAIVTIDSIVGEFSLNEEIVYAGIRDVKSNKIIKSV